MSYRSAVFVFSRICSVFLVCAVLGACSSDREPGRQSAETEPDTEVVTDVSTGQDDVETKDGMSTSDVTSEDAPLTPDVSSEELAETCVRYLECAADARPADVPRLLQEYGEGSPCWQSETTSALCVRSCIAGLSELRQLSSSQACHCQADDECTAPGFMACELATGQCRQCTSDAHCSGQTPACNASGECVACTNDAHCSSALPACNTEQERCVKCTDNAHCGGATPACDSGEMECVVCNQNTDCAVGVCKNKSCKTTCEATLECVVYELMYEGITLGTCLNDDDCCNIGSCAYFAPWRACANQHCGHLTFDDLAELNACSIQHCGNWLDTCATSECG